MDDGHQRVILDDGVGNILGTAANPLSVTGGGGGGGGSNASVGATGATAPADATLIGYQNGAGNLASPVLASDGGVPAHVTNLPATQAVSAAALPFPTGAATAANQPALNADGGALAHVTNLPTTQAVSAAALPLPAGAATAANQPALNADGGALAHVTNFPATQPISLIDGADVTLGAKTDAIATVSSGNAGNFSLISLAKQVITTLLGWLNVNLGLAGAAITTSNPLPVFDGYQAPVATSWTSATAVNTAATFSTAGMDTVIVTVIPSGSITAGHVSFYVYDGTNWSPTKGYRCSTYNGDTGYALTGPSNAWQFSVAGFPQFKVMLDTVITGTGSVTVTGAVSSAPSVDGLTVGLDPAQDSIAGLGGGAANVGGSASVSATGVLSGFPVATAGAQTLALKCATALTGTIIFEGSDDNWTTSFSIYANRLDSFSGAPETAHSNPIAGVIWEIPLKFAQVRARCSAYTSGTGLFEWVLKTSPMSRMTTDQGVGNAAAPWYVVTNGASGATGLSQLAGVIAPATPASTQIKATAGRLYLLDVGNSGASDVWVKLVNASSCTPGTTTMTTNLYVPKGTRQAFSLADLGDYFSSGISYYVSGGIGLTDNTAITANTVNVNARYQ